MIKYQVHKLSDVMDYFVKGYELKGEKLLNYDAYTDTAKGEVVFRLITDSPEEATC